MVGLAVEAAVVVAAVGSVVEALVGEGAVLLGDALADAVGMAAGELFPPQAASRLSAPTARTALAAGLGREEWATVERRL